MSYTRVKREGGGYVGMATSADKKFVKNYKRSRKGTTMVAPSAVIRSEVQRAEMREAYKRAGYVDSSLGTAGVPHSFCADTTQSVHVNVIPCNAGISGRVGAMVKLKSLQIRGVALPVAGGLDDPVQDWAQILIVYDRCPPGNNTIPAISMVKDTDGNPTRQLNNENRERFLIVRKIDLRLVASATDPSTGFYFVDEYIKLKGLKTIFKGQSAGAGDLAETKEGALYVYFCGIHAVATATRAGFYGTSRLRFADVKG